VGFFGAPRCPDSPKVRESPGALARFDRQRWNRTLAAAGYMAAIGSIIWGFGSGDPLPILLGLIVLAILLLTTDG
jgi:hypothetical protein